MGEPCSVKVELTRKKNLGLSLQSAEGRAVDDPISVCLKRRSIVIRFAPFEALIVKAAVETVLSQWPHNKRAATPFESMNAVSLLSRAFNA